VAVLDYITSDDQCLIEFIRMRHREWTKSPIYTIDLSRVYVLAVLQLLDRIACMQCIDAAFFQITLNTDT